VALEKRLILLENKFKRIWIQIDENIPFCYHIKVSSVRTSKIDNR
jgi:hypothetical protein